MFIVSKAFVVYSSFPSYFFFHIQILSDALKILISGASGLISEKMQGFSAVDLLNVRRWMDEALL